MISDRNKIEEVLKYGETILSQRSDLKDIPFNEILDMLDDGTQEMIHNRWGVLAQVIISSITSWEIEALVEHLGEIDCPSLAYEYVGYALQNTHGVILEQLLIEAAASKYFDTIIKYVSSNLQYKVDLHLHLVNPFLMMLEKYSDHSAYHSILHYYAIGIAACDGCLAVATELSPMIREVQYQLIYNLRRYWFAEKPEEANAQIGVFLSQNTVWAWKVAMDYCEWYTPSDHTVLERYYPQIDELVNTHNELKLHVISLLVEYILQTFQEKEKHSQYPIIISKLKLLLRQVPTAKYKFLQKIEYLDDYLQDIYDMFQDILSSPMTDNSGVLKHVDNCFSFMLEKKGYQTVLDDMFKCFSANKYRANYISFFDSLDSTIYALSEQALQITDLAIIYITASNLDYMFFGLGLLVKLGNIKGLYNKKMEETPTYSGSYDEEQLIRIMKAVLFCSIDEDQICHIAFSLLYLAKGTQKKYLQFCMEAVFYDYPIKMHEISDSYAQTGLPMQAELVILVKKAYASKIKLQEKARAIPDLYPSHEHERIYRRAQREQSKEISKKANEKSIFFNLFARRVLKYGRRSGHVIKGSKNQQFYQSSPYQEIRYEHHLPMTYVIDPVEHSMRKYAFIQEVEESASDN